jgi:hypothetical protein
MRFTLAVAGKFEIQWVSGAGDPSPRWRKRGPLIG